MIEFHQMTLFFVIIIIIVTLTMINKRKLTINQWIFVCKGKEWKICHSIVGYSFSIENKKQKKSLDDFSCWWEWRLERWIFFSADVMLVIIINELVSLILHFVFSSSPPFLFSFSFSLSFRFVSFLSSLFRLDWSFIFILHLSIGIKVHRSNRIELNRRDIYMKKACELSRQWSDSFLFRFNRSSCPSSSFAIENLFPRFFSFSSMFKF